MMTPQNFSALATEFSPMVYLFQNFCVCPIKHITIVSNQTIKKYNKLVLFFCKQYAILSLMQRIIQKEIYTDEYVY